MVNGQRHEANSAGGIIVMPEQIRPWDVADFDALKEEDFEVLLELNPEILLLGTGPRLRFPRPELQRVLTRRLAEAGAGLEVMDVQAACRT